MSPRGCAEANLPLTMKSPATPLAQSDACARPILFRSSCLVPAHRARAVGAARPSSLRAGLSAIALLLAAGTTVEAADGPAAPASAAAGTAVISGRVQSAVTGRTLGNARVAVKGRELAVFTDEEVIYRLPAVPSG